MLYRILAELIGVLHFAFVVFVVLGGLLVLRWPRLAWVHLPAAVWGVIIELTGWICPLTPLENRFRRAAGEAAYDRGFIEQYLLPVMYPEGLTREVQIGLAALVLLLNGAIYWVVWRRWRSRSR